MSCRVCGDPDTVQSHIIPRGFINRIKGSGPHVFEGTIDQVGNRFRQSGRWDDTILCASHEAHLCAFDDYAIRILEKKFPRAKSAYQNKVWLCPNPQPELFIKFAASVLWKCSCSSKPAYDLSLGPYESRLADYLFGMGKTSAPLVTVYYQPIVLSDQVLSEMIVEPHIRRDLGRRTYEFRIREFVFLVKLDSRKLKSPLFELRANDRNPLPILKVPSRSILELPGYLDILANMFREDSAG